MTAALIGVAYAASDSGPRNSATDRVAPFARLDVDRDGFVSSHEALKLQGFEAAFNEADENRDGRLDNSEFTRAEAVHDRVRAGQYLDDSVISAKVKAALLKDPEVSGFAVSVATQDGMVSLSGLVKSAEQARRAGDIAAGVRGVVNVKNALAARS